LISVRSVIVLLFLPVTSWGKAACRKDKDKIRIRLGKKYNIRAVNIMYWYVFKTILLLFCRKNSVYLKEFISALNSQPCELYFVQYECIQNNIVHGMLSFTCYTKQRFCRTTTFGPNSRILSPEYVRHQYNPHILCNGCRSASVWLLVLHLRKKIRFFLNS